MVQTESHREKKAKAKKKDVSEREKIWFLT